MKKITGIFTVFLCLFVFSGAALAASEKWEIDKDHSNIYFDVKHTFATVRGLFNEFSGTLMLDPNKPYASSIEIEVKVDSIDTNIAKRDEHLRSDDFFAAEKFPVMTFKSFSVKQLNRNTYSIIGDLTIKDVTKKIEVPFTFYGIKKNPLEEGQTIAGFEAEFAINRLDYNVGNGQFAKMGVVGNEVRIIVTLEALDMRE